MLRETPSEHHHQQHLELLLAEHRMGVTGGHDDRLALLKDGVLAVDGDAADAVQAGDKGITLGLVGADLLPLVEGSGPGSC